MSNFDFGFFLTLFPFAVKSAVLMFILTFPYRVLVYYLNQNQKRVFVYLFHILFNLTSDRYISQSFPIR